MSLSINSEENKKKVAIVVPVYKKKLTAEEKISLKHLLYFLGHYDKYFITPAGLEIEGGSFKIKRFSKKYFKSPGTYSKLLLKKEFYEQFNDYHYILIYQLDALVFSDQLAKWCDMGYDYVGAPWFKSQLDKVAIVHDQPDSCGNGGFSLRNVPSFLKVLARAEKSLLSLTKELVFSEIVLIKKGERNFKQYLRAIKRVWEKSAVHRYPLNEDWFWSFEAPKYYPDFKIPPIEVGLKFAFEVGPRYCFEKNNFELPFGCHAWEKYDKEFWLPYLFK